MAVLVVAMMMSACGDDDASPSTTTAPTDDDVSLATTTAPGDDEVALSTTAATDDVCDDAQALSTSVDDLRDVDLAAEGTDAASAAISAVKDDLAGLRESAGDELQPLVQAVEDAIDELETAVDNLGSDPAGTALEAVSNVAASASTLIATLDDGACG